MNQIFNNYIKKNQLLLNLVHVDGSEGAMGEQAYKRDTQVALLTYDHRFLMTKIGYYKMPKLFFVFHANLQIYLCVTHISNVSAKNKQTNKINQKF